MLEVMNILAMVVGYAVICWWALVFAADQYDRWYDRRYLPKPEEGEKG